MNELMKRRKALMSISKAVGPLPAEYQQVEWISADSNTTSVTAYINTNFIPTPNSSMFTRFAAVGSQGTRNFAGVRDAASGADKAFLIVSFSSARKIGFMRWGAQVQAISYDTNFHDYELTPTSAKIDGVSYSMTAPITSQTSARSIRIFSEYSGSGYRNQSNIRMASLILWEGDVKMRHYIPCYRKSDGEIGMYDTVNKEFKTNVGTGTFTKGADV